MGRSSGGVHQVVGSGSWPFTFRMAALVAACSVLAAEAAILRVPEDHPSILAAVDVAASGDTVLVGPGIWTDTEERVVVIDGSPDTYTCAAFLKGGVTVIGAGPGATVVDAQATGTGYVSPFLLAEDPGEVALEGMTVTGAAGGGAAISGRRSGRVVVRNCRVSHNIDPLSRAIVVEACDLLLEDSEVSFNAGTFPTAAGVDAASCEVLVRRCRFAGNHGRALMVQNPPTHDVMILDCEFVGNRLTAGWIGPGAACSVEQAGSVLIERNVFLRNVHTASSGGALRVANVSGAIRFNVFAHDSTYGGYAGAGIQCVGFSGAVSQNTFVGCHVDPPYVGSAISIDSASNASFSNNIVANGTGGGAISIFGATSVGCNGVWNNEGGLGSYAPGPTDLFLDPQFCDLSGGDYSLAQSSPYTAANSPSCGQVGALGEGCGPVSVEAASWSRIKQMFR